MATWEETQQGKNLRDSWDNLRDTYTKKIPGHTDQLRNLATRPLGG